MEKLRVWVNFDPAEVPLAGLRESFGADERFEYIEKRITDRQEAIAMAAQSDVLINTFDLIDCEVLERIKERTKIIVRYGTGYERIDVDCATRLGIPVANCPGANAPPVAELALLHILNAGRHFATSIKKVQEGDTSGSFSGSELDDKVVGLIGYGNIAQELSRMLGGFRTTILAYDPFISEAAKQRADELSVKLVDSLEELLSAAQILSIHVPLSENTTNLINAETIAMMRPNTILVNTSRGKVIDEEALLVALESGVVAAAGLDVLVEEPPSANNPLVTHPKVSVTSHIAASTYESEMRTQAMIYETVTTFLSGSLTHNVINKKALASRSENAGY